MTTYQLAAATPTQVLYPHSATELAEMLTEASAAGQAVVPWGGGTRQHLCAPPVRYDLALSTAKLTRVCAYHPEDLVVTVEAGITLAELQTMLVAHNQWLPWDAPLPEQATVGGLLASGAAGPLRLGFGAPRDWVLGMRVALGDGRLVKSGGQVVKNVAGYDSHKLHLGAFGTLGVIAEVTFKLQPLPVARASLVVRGTKLAAHALTQLRTVPLHPMALVLLNRVAAGTLAPLVRLSNASPVEEVLVVALRGSEAAVARQLHEAQRRCQALGAEVTVVPQAEEATLWQAIANSTVPVDPEILLLRAATPAADPGPVAALLEAVSQRAGWHALQLGVVGPGIVFSSWPVADRAASLVAAALAEARQALVGQGGYLVVEAMPARLQLDRWGPQPEGIAIMRALRMAWDPRATLNPGRFLIP